MRSWKKAPLFLVVILLLFSTAIYAVNRHSPDSQISSSPEIPKDRQSKSAPETNYDVQTSDHQVTQNEACEDSSEQLTRIQNKPDISQQNSDVVRDTSSGPPLGAEVITSNNSDYVGQDLEGSFIIVAEGETLDIPTNPEIPDNDYFTAVEEDMLPPHRVDAITVADENAPPIIMYNGAMAVFTQADGKGWELGNGDNIRISYNCYPTESGSLQPFLIGYIKDGICYEGVVYKQSSGTWEFEFDGDDDVYNFYFLSAAAEYLSFESITIEVV